MKTSTILIGGGLLAAAAGAIYYFTRPSTAPARQAIAPSNPGQGSNSTLNTVSQVVGIGQQASIIAGNLGIGFN